MGEEKFKSKNEPAANMVKILGTEYESGWTNDFNVVMLGNTLAHIYQLFLLIIYIERLKNKTKNMKTDHMIRKNNRPFFSFSLWMRVTLELTLFW